MSIKTEWGNDEKTILLFTYEPNWSWNDLNDAVTLAYDMMETIDHPVVHIADMRNASILPSGAMTQGRNLANRRHPRQTLLIVVGANSLVRTLGNTFSKIYSRVGGDSRNVYAATLEEAYALAEKEIQQANT